MAESATTYNMGSELGLQYQLKYTGEQIDRLLETVDKKTIYGEATESTPGLMSASDKKKLENQPNGALSEDEIAAVLEN